ncbi:hypothetical protein [Streptomyces sp. NPDC006285]|uniref:hypothetical protein n=1 Tax=Streptomyces sp. NPDC006285 TaxID=3364742 RepID=UPI0036AF0891
MRRPIHARKQDSEVLAPCRRGHGRAGLLLGARRLLGAGLPGAPLFAVVAAAIGAYAAVVALRACAHPESLTDWRTAAAVLCAWMLLPMAV